MEARRGRGRPALVTAERITDAAVAMGLDRLSIKGVAQALGVSEMSIYRHVGNLSGLQTVVAEGLYQRLELTPPCHDAPREALLDHALMIRDFVRSHPGAVPLLMALGPEHGQALTRVAAHHVEWARRYGWPPGVAAVVLASVTTHALAVGDLMVSEGVPRSDGEELPSIAQGQALARDLGDPFEWSMGCLIDGVLTQVERWCHGGEAKP